MSSPQTSSAAPSPGTAVDRPQRAFGLGLATYAGAEGASAGSSAGASVNGGAVLDVWYPAPRLGDPDDAASLDGPLAELTALEGPDEVRGVRRAVVRTEVADLQQPPADTADAWLRLHLLSHRLAAPHSLNLDGVFGLLTNVVWTSAGPCAVEGFEVARARMKAAGLNVAVFGVDKFPRMTDYVVPSGVRIADADRVRLGAHLAAGTTVMHEGFVNYNAGTLGSSMVEGRISAGVVVGDGSDVGGGASIMGTLSGGGTRVISVGRRCLIGANAGIGISLGDDCVVEAGCYVTAGAKVRLTDRNGTTLVKAAELSGSSNVLFRRNSTTGALEAVPWQGDGIALNAALHAND